MHRFDARSARPLLVAGALPSSAAPSPAQRLTVAGLLVSKAAITATGLATAYGRDAEPIAVAGLRTTRVTERRQRLSAGRLRLVERRANAPR